MGGWVGGWVGESLPSTYLSNPLHVVRRADQEGGTAVNDSSHGLVIRLSLPGPILSSQTVLWEVGGWVGGWMSCYKKKVGGWVDELL